MTKVKKIIKLVENGELLKAADLVIKDLNLKTAKERCKVYKALLVERPGHINNRSNS